MNRELLSFTQCDDINNENVNNFFSNTRKINDKFIIELHKQGVIDDVFLKHVIGVKLHNEKYVHISGPSAKYFASTLPAYCYPLFKTHKLSLEELKTSPISNFPVRLLQSAGNITTSRVTAFLEYILSPISKQFCQHQFNEFCQDSKQYLIELDSWKTSLSSSFSFSNLKDVQLVAADVKGLYPNIL